MRDAKDFRELSERLQDFAMLCQSCGWSDNHTQDICRGGSLVGAIADALEIQPVVLNVGMKKYMLTATPL